MALKRWAEVIDGRVWHTFTASDDFAPQFGAPVVLVDITAVEPAPQEGWTYDGRSFTEDSAPVRTEDPDRTEGRRLADITGILTPEQMSAALKLLLRRDLL